MVLLILASAVCVFVLPLAAAMLLLGGSCALRGMLQIGALIFLLSLVLFSWSPMRDAWLEEFEVSPFGASVVIMDPVYASDSPNEHSADDEAWDEEFDENRVDREHGHAGNGADLEQSGATETSSEEPADRPSWVDQPQPQLENGTYKVTVISDPYTTREECEQAMEPQLVQFANWYIRELPGTWGTTETALVDSDYVQANLVKDQWLESRESSVGPMKRLHVRLEFSQQVRNDLSRRIREMVQHERLVQVGGGAAALLACLGTLFGYLTLDTATRGFYTGRLQVLSGGVILAVLIGTLAMFR